MTNLFAPITKYQEKTVMNEVQWFNDFDETCRRAAREDKFVLIDFYDPT